MGAPEQEIIEVHFEDMMQDTLVWVLEHFSGDIWEIVDTQLRSPIYIGYYVLASRDEIVPGAHLSFSKGPDEPVYTCKWPVERVSGVTGSREADRHPAAHPVAALPVNIFD